MQTTQYFFTMWLWNNKCFIFNNTRPLESGSIILTKLAIDAQVDAICDVNFQLNLFIPDAPYR